MVSNDFQFLIIQIGIIALLIETQVLRAGYMSFQQYFLLKQRNLEFQIFFRICLNSPYETVNI